MANQKISKSVGQRSHRIGRALSKFIVFVGIVLALGALVALWRYCECNTGPRSGCVVDARSGEPIQGAIVSCAWYTAGWFGAVGKSWFASYEAITDENGCYYIPNQHTSVFPIFEEIGTEQLIVYRDGYGAYIFEGFTDGSSLYATTWGGVRQEYRKEGNVAAIALLADPGSAEELAAHIEHYLHYVKAPKLRGAIERARNSEL